MAKPIVGWRDKLALWCLRLLTPDGIIGANVPLIVGYGPGSSTPEDPKLVLYFVYEWPSGKRQTVLAPVFGHLESGIDLMKEAVADLREWAAGHG